MIESVKMCLQFDQFCILFFFIIGQLVKMLKKILKECLTQVLC